MINMIGKQFGRLTVLKDTGKRSKFGDIYYLCECNCSDHTKIEVLGANLRRGLTKSCGCYLKEMLSQSRSKDISGKKFGYLTALYPTEMRSGSFVVWKCHCDYCGNDALISLGRLMNGQVTCGKCSYAADRARERMKKWKDPIERTLSNRFTDMITRCYNKKSQDYRDYGGRGIYICKEWTDDRKNFVEWGKKTGFRPGLTIDRIDVNGPYAPWNCRWVSVKLQNNNRRSNRLITISGITATIAQWAFIINKKPITLYQLSLVDNEANDLREYIEYVFSKMTVNEKSDSFSRMSNIGIYFNNRKEAKQ